MANYTLEEELEIRKFSGEQIAKLLNEVVLTTKFIQDKMKSYYNSKYEMDNFIYKLYDSLTAEMWVALDKVELLRRMTETSLLPIVPYLTTDELLQCIMFLHELPSQSEDDKKHIIPMNGVANKLMRACRDTDNAFLHGEEYTRVLFDKMLERYRNENKKAIEHYLHDYIDYSAAVRELKTEYRHSKAVEIWNHNACDINRVVFAMERLNLLEKDLLPLLDYICKYQALQQLNETVTTAKRKKLHESGDIINIVQNGGKYVEREITYKRE